MAEVLVQIVGEDVGAADALKSIEGAMQSVQDAATKTAIATAAAIPTQPLEAGARSAISARGAFGLLSMGLHAVGIQSTALSVGFRAATVSAGILKGGTVALSTALKGLWASLGPVGVAILAVTAAVAGLIALWNREQTALKEQKKAYEELMQVQSNYITMRRKWESEQRKREGKEIEESIASAQEETEERIANWRNLGKEERAKIRESVRDREVEKRALARQRAKEEADVAREREEGRKRIQDIEEAAAIHETELAYKVLANAEDAENKKRDIAKKTADEKEAQAIRETELAYDVALNTEAVENEKRALAKKTAEEEEKQAIRELEEAYNVLLNAEDVENQKRELAQKTAAELNSLAEETADLERDVRKSALEDELTDLQTRLKAWQEAHPEFKPEFFELAEVGRRIQLAALEPPKAKEETVLQARIKEVDEALLKIQREEKALRIEAMKAQISTNEKILALGTFGR